jgi:putative ABC transport system permease protein
MMPADRLSNRTMFWRIVGRLLGANRGRLFVILLALGAGAAVTAALLNLQVDAKRRLTTELRAFGANIIVAPRNVDSAEPATMSERLVRDIPPTADGQPVSVVAFLYFLGSASQVRVPSDFAQVVVAGTSASACTAGARLAARMNLRLQQEIWVANQLRKESCRLSGIESTGGPEDDQIRIPLDAAQRLTNQPGRISLIQISAPGTPAAIHRYVALLAQRLPDAEVRPIRQFTEGEARIYNRISGLLDATVVLILILTALCVMAAMTNVAMERKNDVGLMKAIGGATRRVLRLFLAEAALLGLIGGVLGAAAGIVLSMWLGHAVFGVAARPRLIVYPVAVGLTIIVAIAGAYPLRRLATIRPASVFRGEA